MAQPALHFWCQVFVAALLVLPAQLAASEV
jgi:hypothetical protein